MKRRGPRKKDDPASPRWQSHVRLNEADAVALIKQAERDSRSVTGQIEHYIRRGLKQDAER